MNPPSGRRPSAIRLEEQRWFSGWIYKLAGCLPGLLPILAVRAGEVSPPVLEFVAPVNGAVFSTLDEVPVMLRASAPGDVFLSASVSVNQGSIGTASFCCPFCPCARPMTGQVTVLQIPAPWNGGVRPSNPWTGWRNSMAGTYRFTARAIGESGTVLDAVPVTITIVDLTLRMSVSREGDVILVIQQGSMVPGGYDLEASSDLRTWVRQGAFSPGNVAAFYWDHPPPTARTWFYRAIYVPPPRP